MKIKKYEVKLLNSYNIELLENYNYIFYRLKNPIAAKKLIQKAYIAIENRSYFPKSFQKFISKNFYEWYRIYIGNFTIFYIVEDDEMIVAHMVYGARNIDNII